MSESISEYEYVTLFFWRVKSWYCLNIWLCPFRFNCFVCVSEKLFRQILCKVGGWDLVSWLFSQIWDQPRCYGRMVSGKWPSVKEDLRWKKTFSGRQPLVEDDLQWKTSFSGRQPSVEDALPWILACCLLRFVAFLGSMLPQYMALCISYFRFVCQKKFKPLLSKVGGWALVSWLLSQI